MHLQGQNSHLRTPDTARRGVVEHKPVSAAEAVARGELQRLPDADAEPGRYAAQMAAVPGVQGGDDQANVPGVWDAHKVRVEGTHENGSVDKIKN